MRYTKRKPTTVGAMLKEEFLEPMGLTNSMLAERIGVHRNTISNLVNDKSTLTAPLAIKLAAAFGNSAEFWLNIQHAVDIWETRNSTASESQNIKPFTTIDEPKPA